MSDLHKEAQEAIDHYRATGKWYSQSNPEVKLWIRDMLASESKMNRGQSLRRGTGSKYSGKRTKDIPNAPGPAPSKRAYKPRAYKPTYKTGYTSQPYYRTPTPKKPAMSRKKAYPDSIGATIGGYLGHGIQGVVKALTGFGDYKVQGNSLMSGSLGGNPPIMRNSKNGGLIVRHREYLNDVFASTAFSVTTYPINPGLISSFPWLQQQADSYEQYKFRGLVFEYKSMSSDAVLATSASSALGTVIMSTQYNVLNQPFTDKRTMENYEYANSTKPSLSMMHPIECKMSQTSISELYIRTGAVTIGDLRLYDLGNFSIAVQGMQNAAINQVIGEIWCTYEIEFFKPKLLIGGGALLSDHYYGTGVNAFTVTTPLGAVGALALRSGSNLGTTIQVAAVPGTYGANSIVFPNYITDGTYLITYFMGGTAASVNAPGYTATGTTINIDVVSIQARVFSGGSTSYNQSPQTALNGSSTWSLQQVVRIIQSFPGTAPGIALLLVGGALPSGTTVLDVTVTQLAPSFG